MRRGAIAIGGLITVALAALFAVGGAVRPLSPEARFDAYLRAAAGGEADRGWSFVSDIVRDLSYGNDQTAYIRDAEAADWDAFRWADAEVRWTDDGFRQCAGSATLFGAIGACLPNPERDRAR